MSWGKRQASKDSRARKRGGWASQARGRVSRDKRWGGPVRKARMKGGLNIQGGVRKGWCGAGVCWKFCSLEQLNLSLKYEDEM